MLARIALFRTGRLSAVARPDAIDIGQLRMRFRIKPAVFLHSPVRLAGDGAELLIAFQESRCAPCPL
jgi:hypothetical protein